VHPAGHPPLWDDLDNVLIEAARKLAPWLSLDQLDQMHRRDILELLAAATTIPLGGIDLLWSGAFPQVSIRCCSALRKLQQYWLVHTALLRYYEQRPGDVNRALRARLQLLEQAEALATRYAPGIVQMAISGWLGEDKAAAKDSYGADQALERAQRALAKAEMEGLAGKVSVQTLAITAVGVKANSNTSEALGAGIAAANRG
jgi:hypothetical protein